MNSYKNKIKTALLLAGLVSANAFAQVGMGNENPRGILDVNNPLGYGNTSGIVLPRVNNTPVIKAPGGADAVPGTIVYDVATQGVRVMTANRGWTGPLLDEPGVQGKAATILSIGADFKIKAASMGLNHTLVIGKDDNAVYTAGSNNYACTGLGRAGGRTQTFTLIFARPVVSVAAGEAHSLLADTEGQVWVWGYNYDYRTGLPDDPKGTEGEAKGNSGSTGTPTLCITETGKTIPYFGDPSVSIYGKAIQVAASADNSFVLTEDGTVYSVGGKSESGTGAAENLWARLSIPAKVVQISAAQHSVAALTEHGDIYVWGQGGNYRLGTGSTKAVTTPTKITMPRNTPCKSVAMGIYNGAAISADGSQLFAWGYRGTVGIGDGKKDITTPDEVTDFPNYINPSIDKFVEVAAQRFGYGGLTVITDNNVVLSTGRNRNGQGGTGTKTDLPEFVKARDESVVAGTKFIGVARGGNNTILITDENKQYPNSSYVGYGMGNPNNRQLGAINMETTVPRQLSK